MHVSHENGNLKVGISALEKGVLANALPSHLSKHLMGMMIVYS